MKGSSKLSDLKEGDWFNFRNNVTAKYIVGSYSLQDLETKEFMRFKVLKINAIWYPWKFFYRSNIIFLVFMYVPVLS